MHPLGRRGWWEAGGQQIGAAGGGGKQVGSRWAAGLGRLRDHGMNTVQSNTKNGETVLVSKQLYKHSALPIFSDRQAAGPETSG